MKYEFISDWHRRSKVRDSQDEDKILKSKYSPNQKVLFKNRVFKLNYPDVIESELTWLAETADGWFWLKEKDIL